MGIGIGNLEEIENTNEKLHLYKRNKVPALPQVSIYIYIYID